MSVQALAGVIFYVCITRLQNTVGESISFGKNAKQSTTFRDNDASHALNRTFSYTGSVTGPVISPWWEVDLRGYFRISIITLTAGEFHQDMRNASVEVMDKDVSLSSDVQSEWCGNVPSTVTAREEFTFTCNATFPVRYVRVTRRSTTKAFLAIGHVDVQGIGATKRCRSHYTPTANRNVSIPFLTTSAITAGACGILCHKSFSCIGFSYSTTASSEANCMLTDKVVPQNYVADHAWSMYTLDSCL
ncbi:uncharacterized protein LOC124110659 [Haliotis rufescens]|uniref:uncharacterized protein LOC124110659 n=1 Tax=Haliotis rufescens TaxID=6454 RepID=UPI00201F2B89|nr:uncharacterized protein LOC124110659 [Haliotis rufescens]